MNTLLERLVSWAQNEEMINQYYTDHGKDCNEAVKEIERLTAELEDERAANAHKAVVHANLQARVDDLVDAISSGSHSQMMDALYNKQGESDE